MLSLPNLPDVWGEGALFAFSGLDGPTDTRTGFVAAFAAQPYDLLFHTPTRRVLEIRLPSAGRVLAATNDVLAVETPSGSLLVTYSAWHSLVIEVPGSASVALRLEDGSPAVPHGDAWISPDPDDRDCLALARRGGRLALAYGFTQDEALERAYAALDDDPHETVARRMAFLSRMPRLEDAARDRLLKKCASVMKVNTLAGEGQMRQHWSTPDRVPHRHMWLWDTVFHSLAMNHLDPRLSWETLKSLLDAQRPDGMLPHMTTVAGHTSGITQPPILAQGVWENYCALQDREALADALPRLERYLEWDLVHRDQNQNGLLEWFIEGDANCRSGESGLDNSPRFDEAVLLDAVDFSTFAALDLLALSRIAQALGQDERAQFWQSRAQALSARIHDLLWDEQDGFYYDRAFDGNFSRVRAVTGFLPLLLPDLPPERVERLSALLEDPAHFNTPCPLPSVSVSHPAWGTDMWRGATWVNLNYLVIQGLRLHGREAQASRLADQTIEMVGKYYDRFGVLFEFFDACDERPPLACDRKGPRVEPYDIRRKYDSIRDYHWTAALTYNLLLESSQGV